MHRIIAVFDKKGEPGFLIGELRLDAISVDDIKSIISPYPEDPDMIMCYTLTQDQLTSLLSLLPALYRKLFRIDHSIYEYSLEASR